MAIEKLLFVDANIWLDFYRVRSEAGLALLKHLEAVSNKIIVTYQLEMEFKKNRQFAIKEGLDELKSPQSMSRPGLFSDAQDAKALQKSLKEADARVRKLKGKLLKALDNPAANDPVYQACQRIFHQESDLVLTRDNPVRRSIRRQAFRRFLIGCPPRKKGDTSIGDAINWEWMIECAVRRKAELVIVTRDTDYGLTLDGKAYINDHLKHEFSDRVSKKRKILLYSRLSDALKHFKIDVTPQEIQEEEKVAKRANKDTARLPDHVIQEILEEMKHIDFGTGAKPDDIFG
ncbi:PIN domain-containing protein [Parvibaculum sp.]|uniref:PIN domain-containing protein n=1 Tax=Parvibaculum sp. TaxID=2024848 RepID=UPI00391DB99D